MVQEYLKAPPANMLPQLSFTSTLSVCLEEGMCQMSGVITEMSDRALLDQGSQGPKESAWKSLKLQGTTTPNKWRKYVFNSETCFSYVEAPWL